jgi:hypothetical protein
MLEPSVERGLSPLPRILGARIFLGSLHWHARCAKHLQIGALNSEIVDVLRTRSQPPRHVFRGGTTVS